MPDEYILLPRGKTKVLRAEDKNYKRGLLVRLKKDGGYRVAYWYEEPDKPNEVEVIVDGKSIKKDAKVVEFKFHPENYYEGEGQVKAVKEEIKISKADMAKLHKDGQINIDGEKLSIEERLDLFLEKNVPTKPSKWSYYKSQAKKKFDVYPSAYANGWAAKQYKAAGGGWKKESVNEVFLKEDIEVLKKIVKELEGASKMHASQAKRIQDHLDDMKVDEVYSLRDVGLSPFYKKLSNNQKQAVSIALVMGGNMTKAIQAIEKIKTGLSKDKKVKNALRMANESINEKSKGLWHNINAKKKRGEKSSPKNSKAYKSAKAAGDRLNRNESYTNEYNVENYHDIKEFVEFMASYKSDINEAEYQGRKVKLGKPMQGDTKKFKVYVKNPKGNVVKVNFGQGGDAKGGTMRIRKNNPKARANFRARHNCDSPGPRHKARYWSCRKW